MADVQVHLVGTIGPPSIQPLMSLITNRVNQGARSILLAISSPGGNIYWGVTAYNFLRGLDIDLATHNVGQVDSIAGVIYCAGQRRLCVPNGRFLIHGVAAQFMGNNPSLGEKDLRSRLGVLERDRETVASILSERTGKALDKVKSDMLNERILTAEEGRDYGFATEITEQVFNASQEILQVVVP